MTTNNGMAAHTPGPWRWERIDSTGVDKWVLIGGDTYTYGILECDVDGSPQGLNDPANARLIASSPALYAALDAILPYAANMLEHDHPVVAQARTALKLAMGDEG
jgi:hypothetical protein